MQIETICQAYSAEIACVIFCCRVFIKTATAEELEQFIVTHDIDWQEVYKLSALHRVRPVVYNVLANNKKIPVPASALSQFYNYCQVLSLFAFERRVESVRIQNLLSQHQVPTRMYKGLDFTMMAYGGDIGMREFTDMDLIVDQQNLPALIEVMIAEGYTSSQLNYFRRFPRQFIKGKKDICFEKRNANGRVFCFEFHYRPTGNMLDMPLGFRELLGKDYLTSTLPITRQQYYQLMLINHGMSDYYPNLRSLVDLVLLAGTHDLYVPQLLQQHERLGKVLIDRLLKGDVAEDRNKYSDVLTKRLLTPTPAGFKEKMTMRIRFSISPRSLIRALQFMLLPNEMDINQVRFRYFQMYYFIKPFRLLRRALKD
jgi:hypothetical protein